jgi:hypothetical protein
VIVKEFFNNKPGLNWALIFMTVFFVLFFIAFFLLDGQKPRVLLIDVIYDTNTNCVKGKITEIGDSRKFAVIVYIRQDDGAEEYFAKPNDTEAIHPIEMDGSFEVWAYAYDTVIRGNDKRAQYYSVLLVPADLDYKELKNGAIEKGVSVWDLAKNLALDAIWNARTRNQE